MVAFFLPPLLFDILSSFSVNLNNLRRLNGELSYKMQLQIYVSWELFSAQRAAIVGM